MKSGAVDVGTERYGVVAARKYYVQRGVELILPRILTILSDCHSPCCNNVAFYRPIR